MKVVNVAKRRLTIELTGDDKNLNDAWRRADSNAGGFGQKMVGIGKVVAGAFAAATAAVGGITAGLFSVGRGFDEAYDTIIAGTGASGDALAGLKDDFKEVLGDAEVGAGDVATAIADINTALGLTGQPLQDLSTQMLDLSRIADQDIGSVVQSTTRLFGDWGISVEDQAGALDKLWSASQLTGASIGQLSDQAVAFGAPLRQLGFGFEDTIALFGKWQKEGVNTETIMSGIRQGIGKMAAAGKDVPTAFRDALTSIQNMGSDSEATAEAIKIFGQRAGPDMAAAIREGRFEIDDLVTALGDADGAIADTADATASFDEKWQKFKNKTLVALEPLATKVFEGVGVALDKAMPYVEQFTGWMEDNLPAAFDRVMGVAQAWWPRLVSGFNTVRSAITSAVDTALPYVQDLVGWLRENLPAAFDRVKAVVEAWWPRITEAFETIVDVVTQVVTTVKGWFEQFTDSWSSAGDSTEGTVSRIKRLFEQVSSTVQTVITAVVEIVRYGVDLVQRIWAAGGDQVLAGLHQWFDGMVQTFTGAFEIIEGIVKFFMAVFKGDWEAAWEAIKQVVSGAIDVVVGFVRGMGGLLQAGWAFAKGLFENAFRDSWEWVKTTTSDAIDAIVGWVEDLPGKISEKAKGAFDGIVDAVKGAVRAIAMAWNRLDISIPRFEVPDWVPGIGGKGWGPVDVIPDVSVPGLKYGALVPRNDPFLAVLGDNKSEAEIVSPVSTMEAAVERVLSRQAPQGGAQPVQLVLDGRVLGEVMVNYLARESRLRGA